MDFNSSAAFEHSMSILIGQSEQRRRLFAAETVRLGSAAKDAAWKLLLRSTASLSPRQHAPPSAQTQSLTGGSPPIGGF